MIRKFRKNHSLENLLFLRAFFTAFQKNIETDEIIKAIEDDEKKDDFKRIRCPLCRWQPTASSRWFCADADAPEFFYNSCGTMWNTFATRGKCPGCRHQWRWTTCLRCGKWSRHEDWYESRES